MKRGQRGRESVKRSCGAQGERKKSSPPIETAREQKISALPPLKTSIRFKERRRRPFSLFLPSFLSTAHQRAAETSPSRESYRNCSDVDGQAGNSGRGRRRAGQVEARHRHGPTVDAGRRRQQPRRDQGGLELSEIPSELPLVGDVPRRARRNGKNRMEGSQRNRSRVFAFFCFSMALHIFCDRFEWPRPARTPVHLRSPIGKLKHVAAAKLHCHAEKTGLQQGLLYGIGKKKKRANQKPC